MKINTRILAVVTYETILLYSALGNVVVRSSPTIRATRKLSEAGSVTDPVRILCGIKVLCSCFLSGLGGYHHVLNLDTDVYTFLFISNSGNRDLSQGYCATPPAFNKNPAFILQNTAHSPSIY